MDSGTGPRALPRVGFAIRRSRDQRLVSTYPGLFAAADVLRGRLAAGQPPCALRLLIVDEHLFLAAMEFSRCARSRRAAAIREDEPTEDQNDLPYRQLRRGRPTLLSASSAVRPALL